MKKSLFVLVFLLLVNNYNAQKKPNFTEGEVVYEVVSGEEDPKKIEKELSDELRIKDEKTSKILNVVFSKKTAKLKVSFKENKILSKPDVEPEAKTLSKFNTTQIMLESEGIFYADLSKNMVYNDTDLSGKRVVVGRKISDLKWNITNETKKTPKGNKLTKAIAKYKFEKDNGKLIIKEVTAWFTEDIPVRVAPLQFYGLPGLVVKLEVEGMSFSLSSINSKKVNVDYKIDHKKVITEDQYMDLMDKIYN